jgi:hypothetical protein
MTAPTAIKALFRDLPTAVLAKNKRQGFITARALHLLLLEIQAFDKTLDLPLISFKLIEKLPGPFIREEMVEIIILPRKEGVQIHLFLFLLFSENLRGLAFFLFHKAPLLYRIALLFCQPQVIS